MGRLPPTSSSTSTSDVSLLGRSVLSEPSLAEPSLAEPSLGKPSLGELSSGTAALEPSTPVSSSQPAPSDDYATAPLAFSDWGVVLDRCRQWLIPGADPVASPAIHSLLLRLLWIGLGEVHQLFPAGTLAAWGQHPQDYCRFWAGFDNDSHPTHALPQTAPFTTVVQAIQKASRQLAWADPHQVLAWSYEYLLGRDRKPDGIYYTPPDIVAEIIHHTLDRDWATPQSPVALSQVTVVDPACGSGLFLVAAYRWFSHHYRQQYQTCHRQKYSAQQCHQQPEGEQILARHLHGVDVDPQAVELTRLSLLWEVLTDRARHRSSLSQKTAPEAIAGPITPLPHRCIEILKTNIRWGNALVGQDILVQKERAQKNAIALAPVQLERIRPFDWGTAFPQVFQRGGFDVVLGNPPYVDAEDMSHHHGEERRYCTQHYATASGNWDLFCVFCEKAMQVCRPNGLVSFVVPNKLGAADYAQATRTMLAVDHQLLHLRDYSRRSAFAIAVYPLVFVTRRCRPTGETVTCHWDDAEPSAPSAHTLPYAHVVQPGRPWAIAPSSIHRAIMAKMRQQGIPLAQLATVYGAATVAEAYALKPLIEDAAPRDDGFEEGVSEGLCLSPHGRDRSSNVCAFHLPPANVHPSDLRFVNSGTLDPYQLLWNQKAARYLKSRYQAPIIPAHHIAHLPPRRLAQARQRKIIIAGMTLGLECALDATGQFLAGKSTTLVYHDNAATRSPQPDLRYLLAILNSRLMGQYYRTEFGGNALNGGYLRVGPPQIKTLPIVLGGDRQQAAIIALVDEVMASVMTSQLMPPSLLAEIDRQVEVIYGLTDAERIFLQTQSHKTKRPNHD